MDFQHCPAILLWFSSMFSSFSHDSFTPSPLFSNLPRPLCHTLWANDLILLTFYRENLNYWIRALSSSFTRSPTHHLHLLPPFVITKKKCIYLSKICPTSLFKEFVPLVIPFLSFPLLDNFTPNPNVLSSLNPLLQLCIPTKHSFTPLSNQITLSRSSSFTPFQSVFGFCHFTKALLDLHIIKSNNHFFWTHLMWTLRSECVTHLTLPP